MLKVAGGLLMASALVVAAAAIGKVTSMEARDKAAATSLLVEKLSAERRSTTDLEIGDDVIGLPPRATRYLSRGDLLSLRQVTYTVTDDSNFKRPTTISGVALEELVRDLGADSAGTADSAATMVVAISVDKYRANYPRAYLAAHHPVLVLTLDGKGPLDWHVGPKDSTRYDLGPYMISHAKFTPSFRILSHADEPQIPWGVVRLEFRNEAAVFGAIAPRGPHASDADVQAGYKIAKQNCFRCHNMGAEGGHKSGVGWPVLSAMAATSTDFFRAYVRNPKARSPGAQMPGNPGYDDATLRALASYFQTFSVAEKQ
jgi:mono/diheme cytochrome c family protein